MNTSVGISGFDWIANIQSQYPLIAIFLICGVAVFALSSFASYKRLKIQTDKEKETSTAENKKFNDLLQTSLDYMGRMADVSEKLKSALEQLAKCQKEREDAREEISKLKQDLNQLYERIRHLERSDTTSKPLNRRSK